MVINRVKKKLLKTTILHFEYQRSKLVCRGNNLIYKSDNNNVYLQRRLTVGHTKQFRRLLQNVQFSFRIHIRTMYCKRTCRDGRQTMRIYIINCVIVIIVVYMVYFLSDVSTCLFYTFYCIFTLFLPPTPRNNFFPKLVSLST